MNPQQSLAKPAALAAVGLTCAVLSNVYQDTWWGPGFFLLGVAAVVIAWYRRSK